MMQPSKSNQSLSTLKTMPTLFFTLIIVALLPLSSCGFIPLAEANNPIIKSPKETANFLSNGTENIATFIVAESLTADLHSTSHPTAESTVEEIITHIEFVPLTIPRYNKSVKTSIMVHSSVSDHYWLDFMERSQAGLTKFAHKQPAKDSFWEALSAEFQLLNEQPINEIIQKKIDFFAAHPKTFNQTLKNSVPYFKYIYNKLRTHKVPAELVLLPLVESGYRVRAVSHAGAAGIWQFTKRTGEFYGLQRNIWYDGRYDIAASTESAINLLLDLYVKLESWPLVLASYNYGIGNVNKRN